MPIELHVRRQPLVAALLAIMAALIALSLIDAIIASEHPIIALAMDRIRLDSERSISAFFCFLIFLIAFKLLTLIAIGKVTRRDPWRWHWVGLACVFLFLAYDEAASLHEMLTDPLREALGVSGFFYFAWVIPGMILVACVFLIYLRFLLRLQRRYALLFVASGAVFIAGALGVELITAQSYEESYDDGPYHLLTTLEESLEMAGIILFIHALLRYLEEAGSAREVRIRFEPEHGAQRVPERQRTAPVRSVGERPAP